MVFLAREIYRISEDARSGATSSATERTQRIPREWS